MRQPDRQHHRPPSPMPPAAKTDPPRSVAPTEAGAALLAPLLPAMAQLDEAVVEVGAFSDRPRGRVRLYLPRLAAEVVLAPRLALFTELYPEIALDLVVEDSLTGIVAGGFDAGIRPVDRVQGDMIAVRLTPDLHPAVFASPAYLASRSTPTTPHELVDHRCINYRWSHNGSTYRWRFERDREVLEVLVDALVTINDTNVIIAAALGGSGFAYMLEDVVAEHVKAGRLVRGARGLVPAYFGLPPLLFRTSSHVRAAEGHDRLLSVRRAVGRSIRA
jgi:DNA-binding transcriptional LysR family regulator